MRKSLIPSTLLATALACSSPAFAATPPPPPAPGASSAMTTSQPRHHGMWHRRMHHRHHHAMDIFGKLNLSDAQRSNVRQLMRQDFAQARSDMQALRKQHRAFENATPGSSGYRAATSDLAQAESDFARARVLRRADLRTKIYNLLTPAQRTQLADIRSQREARMQQWRESHMQHRSSGAPASSAAAH